MRLCVVQEVLKCYSGPDQQRLSCNMCEELIEDASQLLRQCNSPNGNFRPSVIIVYATAIAISGGQELDKASEKGMHGHHRQTRSRILLQLLGESCHAWGFARQVYNQLTLRCPSLSTMATITSRYGPESENVRGSTALD